MQRQPLPIPGLPLAPPVPGLTVLEDVRHATSSHPRRPITPIPVWQQTAAVEEPTRRSRWERHGEYQGAQHRPRPHAVTPTATHDSTPRDDHRRDSGRSFFPARRYRKEIPDLVPIRPEAFAAHHHPLGIRMPWDVVRFFPLTIGVAATCAALSGLFAGGLANRLSGGNESPLLFMAGYLALFALNLWTHYFSAKGQLFFVNKRRFLRLLVANAVVLVPHFIGYSLVTALAK